MSDYNKNIIKINYGNYIFSFENFCWKSGMKLSLFFLRYLVSKYKASMPSVSETFAAETK